MPHPADESRPSTSLLEQPQVKAVWVARQMKLREAEFTETDSMRYAKVVGRCLSGLLASTALPACWLTCWLL